MCNGCAHIVSSVRVSCAPREDDPANDGADVDPEAQGVGVAGVPQGGRGRHLLMMGRRMGENLATEVLCRLNNLDGLEGLNGRDSSAFWWSVDTNGATKCQLYSFFPDACMCSTCSQLRTDTDLAGGLVYGRVAKNGVRVEQPPEAAEVQRPGRVPNRQKKKNVILLVPS